MFVFPSVCASYKEQAEVNYQIAVCRLTVVSGLLMQRVYSEGWLYESDCSRIFSL